MEPDNEFELAANDLGLSQYDLEHFLFPNPNQGMKRQKFELYIF